MRRNVAVLAAVIGVLATTAGGWGQASGTGSGRQGFNVTTLIAQLSLYLPEEDSRAMFARGGRGAGGQSGSGQSASGGAQSRFQTSFTRDAKLFLTRDQIAKLLPVMATLKDNPMPTPSKAKQVQADVDTILTAAQKAEYAQFQKEMEKLRESFRQQAAAGGSRGSGAVTQGSAGGSAGQLTPLERRQRQVVAFIKVLQSRQTELGA